VSRTPHARPPWRTGPPPGLGPLAGSTDSRARDFRTPVDRPRRPSRRERGIALILALTAVAILSVVLADMHQNTATAYALATTERDRLKAEYLARSGISLTRLLVAAEPQIRQMVTPLYQGMIGRPPPQIPIWTYADDVLRPFCRYQNAEGLSVTGIDFGNATGLGDTTPTTSPGFTR